MTFPDPHSIEREYEACVLRDGPSEGTAPTTRQAVAQAQAHYQAHGIPTIVYIERDHSRLVFHWCDENSPAYRSNSVAEHSVHWSSAYGPY